MPLTPNELSAQEVATIHYSIKNMTRLLGKLYESKASGHQMHLGSTNPLDDLRQIILSMNSLPVTKELLYKPTGNEPKVNGEIDLAQLDDKQAYITLTEDEQKNITKLKSLMVRAQKTLNFIAKAKPSPEVQAALEKSTQQVAAVTQRLTRVAEATNAPSAITNLANAAVAERKARTKPPAPTEQATSRVIENYDPNKTEGTARRRRK